MPTLDEYHQVWTYYTWQGHALLMQTGKLFMLMIMYSLCVMASRSDDRDDELYKQHKATNLSNLEQQVVDNVMEYHNSKVAN
jgi:hypothetical protein